jgi:hypothetical protein
MKPSVLAQLKSALSTHTPKVYEDSQLTVSLLRDLSGPDESKWEISALAGAVREDIPATLLRSRNSPVPPGLGDRLVRKLRDNHAIGAEEARWAVQTWAAALEVPGLRFSSRGAGPVSETASPQAKERIGQLVTEAARVAMTIQDPDARPVALAAAATAAAMSMTDPGPAQRLLDEALKAVQAAPGDGRRALLMHDISVALAGAYPEHAEQLALESQGLLRDDALDCLVRLLARTDTDRALRLAWSIGQESLRQSALSELAAVMADNEPDRARNLARSLTDAYWRAEALCQVAAVLLLEQPDRAGALLSEAVEAGRSAKGRAAAAAALSSAARVIAGADADQAARLCDEAEDLARSVPEEPAQSAALGSLAIALAAADPDHALELARPLSDDSYAVCAVARVLTGTDPDRAVRLAQSVPPGAQPFSRLVIDLAAANADVALRLAWTIPADRAKATALAGIARTLNVLAPDRAARLLEDTERYARQMAGELDMVITLADLAAAWAGN